MESDRITETDLVAARAFTILESQRCSCGCGGWSDECLNPDLQDAWEPAVNIAWRDAALIKGREHFKDELKEPGAYLYLKDTRRDDG